MRLRLWVQNVTSQIQGASGGSAIRDCPYLFDGSAIRDCPYLEPVLKEAFLGAGILARFNRVETYNKR